MVTRPRVIRSLYLPWKGLPAISAPAGRRAVHLVPAQRDHGKIIVRPFAIREPLKMLDETGDEVFLRRQHGHRTARSIVGETITRWRLQRAKTIGVKDRHIARSELQAALLRYGAFQ